MYKNEIIIIKKQSDSMDGLSLKLIDINGQTIHEAKSAEQVYLIHNAVYVEGDEILFEPGKSGFYEVRFEDSMPAAIVYVKDTASFKIPCGDKRMAYSPKSFAGEIHLISARQVSQEEYSLRRNLAFNPYDQMGDNTGMYPHASANIETRGESVFAARNVIDGIYANHCHGKYPFQSWGINRRSDAELKVEIGIPAVVDELVLTLRADFPHDSYWTKATAVFTDGSSETLVLKKMPLPQSFRIKPRTAEGVMLKDLIKANDESPFPALTQFEIWGKIIQ